MLTMFNFMFLANSASLAKTELDCKIMMMIMIIMMIMIMMIKMIIAVTQSILKLGPPYFSWN